MLIAFFLKVLGSIGYGLIHQYYYGGADTWSFFNASVLIFKQLFGNNPQFFWKLTFGSNGYTVTDPELFKITSRISAWQDVRSYTVVRFNVLLQFISFGYYYVHAVFWAFISFVGLIAFYKTIILYYPFIYKRLYFVLFLIPSVIFWDSGLHKEGLTMFFLGFIVYHTYKCLHVKVNFISVLSIIACLLLVSILRYYVILLWIPAWFGWIITCKYPKHTLLKFIGIYVFGVLCLQILACISNTFDVFARLSYIRFLYIYYGVGAGGEIGMDFIEPNLWEFIKFIPFALYNTLIRPLLWESKNILQLIAAVENLFFIIGSATALLFANYKQVTHKYFFYFCVFFSATYLMLIGITVNNIGAIVRYRAVVMPFGFLPYLVLLENNFFLKKKLFFL